MTRHVGITGTQEGGTDAQLNILTELFQRMKVLGYRVLHHGDCVGVDEQADALAKQFGYETISHPPLKKDKRAFTKGHALEHEPLEYIARNEEIVKAVEVLLAVPKEEAEQLRSGTWATVRRARRYGVTCLIIKPSGAMVVEDNVK